MLRIFLHRVTITIVVIIIFLNNLYPTCNGERIRYISTEHPNVTYLNPNFIEYFNLTSKRYGRASPFYYVGIDAKTLVWMDTDLKAHFYFYEFLSNEYRRGFIEMHFNFCDLMNDKFFGAPMRQGNLTGPCPYPPGIYNLYNMSIAVGVIPRSFPFTKGRIYCNATYKTFMFGTGYIDMEVKEINVKRQMNRKGLVTLP